MKRAIALVLLWLLAFQSHAQRGAPAQAVQRVQAAKVGYITERLSLTPEQAERFWPVYHRYESEQRATRRSIRAAMGEHPELTSKMSEADSRKTIEENLKWQESRLQLKQKYKDEFLKVISAQQLLALYRAEQDFNRLLLNRVREGRSRPARQKTYFAPED